MFFLGGGISDDTRPCEALSTCLGLRPRCALGGKKVALRRGGGVTQKPIFPTPPPSLLGCRDGRGG